MTASSCTTRSRVPLVRPLPHSRRLSRALIAAFDRLLAWQENVRSRHALLSLDDRMLRDVGIDRAAAEAEARRPFWHSWR